MKKFEVVKNIIQTKDNAHYDYNKSAKNDMVLCMPPLNINNSNETLITKLDSYNCETTTSK
jgi:hypothetical protein